MNQQKIWREENGLLKRNGSNSGRIDLSALYARRKGDYRRLDDVLAYCEDSSCFRSRILSYFGETPAHRCGYCSACSGKKPPAAVLTNPIVKPEAPQKRIIPPIIWEADDHDVLWHTAHRCYRKGDLKARQVQRNTGLAIIGAVKEAGTSLGASALANVLCGARTNSYVAKHPELLALMQFGAEEGRNYNEVFLDVLAMWAKGYLRPESNESKRLESSKKGVDALTKAAEKSI
jgi:superfamily II DNA helicase RecQ